MNVDCPYCELIPGYVSDFRTVIGFGIYHRTSDSKDVKRYRCLLCKRTFSQATKDPCFRQKKRQFNRQIKEHLGSLVSQRATARLLRLNKKTVDRRVPFLGRLAKEELYFANATLGIGDFFFDDLETIEHTKLKPVSVSIVVTKDRRVVGLRTAPMAAKGVLAKRAIKKYGFRPDGRSQARNELFSEIAPFVKPQAIIMTDQNPYYKLDIKRHFPNSPHITHKGQKSSLTGSGELKKIEWDPLFSINHTFAMFRANVCRLIRKTWCTTKKIERLDDHLAIYAVYHNERIAEQKLKKSKKEKAA